jgi:hypothetical protein
MGVSAHETATGKANAAPWRRLLLWAGGAFLAFNVLSLAIFVLAGTVGWAIKPLGFVAAVLVVLWPFGGFNVLRTWANPARADFQRRNDPEGGHVFEVRPARASWLPVLVLAPLCLFLGVLWSGYVAAVLGVAVGAIFLAPGARHRRRARIYVSSEGLRSGRVELALDRVAEISVGNSGVGISPEPLVPGPGGVSTSSLAGRGMARRQAARSFTVAVRGDGQAHATVVAGGLTEACAFNLAHELTRSVERFAGETSLDSSRGRRVRLRAGG